MNKENVWNATDKTDNRIRNKHEAFIDSTNVYFQFIQSLYCDADDRFGVLFLNEVSLN